MELDAGVGGALRVVLVQSEELWLDGDVSESEGGSGEHVGDAWVSEGAVPSVGGEEPGGGVRAQDTREVISPRQHLRGREGERERIV